MIEGIHLCKSFGDRELFKDFSFQIEDGDFVCFSGKSGKGKTTLLNMIGLLEPPSAGKILFDGKEIKTNQDRLNFFRSKVGFIFQNFALIEGKTVEQNLALVRKSNRENISFQQALERVGLSGKEKSKVYTLSGGEQQRVALARLFLKKCDLILADEPTGSLDDSNAKMVIQILQELNAQGKTVIIVTHHEAIKKICKKIIAL